MPKEGSKPGRSGKSSKTARVMNLLIDPDALTGNSAASGGDTSSGASAPAAGAKRTVGDENTQEQIRSALETELTESTVPMPREPAAAPVAEQIQTPPEQPPAPAVEPEPPAQEVSAPEQPPAPQEKAPELDPAPSMPDNPAKTDEEDSDDDYICFNVTQALVEDKTDKYMKMFGMCTCNRCRIDVVALALSNLPAKYVVAKPKDMIPRLSMYESKYSAAVITQVMKACKKVIDLPHHKR